MGREVIHGREAAGTGVVRRRCRHGYRRPGINIFTSLTSLTMTETSRLEDRSIQTAASFDDGGLRVAVCDEGLEMGVSFYMTSNRVSE